MTVLEVTIAMAVTAVIVLASAAAFLTSLTSVNSSQRVNQATVFAATVLEDLTAQPYDQLLTFNGNTIYDQVDGADSNFEVQLTVFVAEVNLIQINAVLNDLKTDRQLASFTTLRTIQ